MSDGRGGNILFVEPCQAKTQGEFLSVGKMRSEFSGDLYLWVDFFFSSFRTKFIQKNTTVQ